MRANSAGPNVAIVLSTYNGARFIVDQLESLQRQTYPHWSLLVRDDGSTDETIELISRKASSDNRIKIVDVGGANIGVVASFSKLLEIALSYDADYYFLCDQDDVWSDTKLEQFIAEFKSIERKLAGPTPILVHSDLTVVNEGMELVSPSFMRYQKICNVDSNPTKVLLSQNFATGCASAVNRELLELAVPMRGVIMHDWWLALLASVTGKIGYLDRSTIAYRQHGSNTVGAKKVGLWCMLQTILSPQMMHTWEEKQQRLIDTFVQSRHLADRLKSKGVGSAHSIWVADTFAGLAEKNPFSRVWVAMHLLGIRKIGTLRNILFVMQLLFVGWQVSVRKGQRSHTACDGHK